MLPLEPTLYHRMPGLMTYNFDNLTIDMPKTQGPDDLHLGSVKWTINGKIIIATEAYKKQDVIIGSRKNVKP